MGVLYLRHVEDAVRLGFYQERIVVGCPAIVACPVVKAVAERPSLFGDVEVKGESRKGIVGYGIAGSHRGKDATGAVGKERCDGGCEEVFVHIPHTYKQMARVPLVHEA